VTSARAAGRTVGISNEVTRRADHVDDDQPLWPAFSIELPGEPIADGERRK
jgi:hypothetical protein